MRPEMFDCTVPSALAAAEKLPWSAMPTSASSCLRSMSRLSDFVIQTIRLMRLHDEAQTRILVSYRTTDGTPPPKV